MAGCENTRKPPLRALFAFTNRDHGVILGGGLLCATGAGIVKPVMAILMGYIFDDLTDFGSGTLSSHQLLSKVGVWTLALIGLGIATSLFNGGLFFFWVLFGELQAKSVRQRIFSGLLEKDMEWFDLHEDGISVLTTRIQTQTRELQMAASQPMGMVTMDIMTATASIGVALYESWNLSLAILAIIPVASIIISFISARIQPEVERQKQLLSVASKSANSAITLVDTVKVFSAEEHEHAKYSAAINRAGESYTKQARAAALQMGIARFIIMAMFVSGFWYGVDLVNKGLTAGTVLTTFYSCLQATQCMEAILPQWLVLAKGISAGATLQRMVVEFSQSRQRYKQGGIHRLDSIAGAIEMRNITFAYPSNPSHPVLRNVSVSFPSGETTFVIGKSGSGKSTLGNLLMRFYEPTSGDILLDGRPIQTLQSEWLRNNVTLVQQQSSIFNETVFQNVAFGRRTDQFITEDDVLLACQACLLEETLQKLPDGIDTVVGQDGKSLSGGQRQRISLARAKLRNTPILILDEATSALDPTSRLLMMRSIRQWRQHRTTIIITHDISQIQDDEYVYVLENSQLVEDGYRRNLESRTNGRFNAFYTAAERRSRVLSMASSCRTTSSSTSSNVSVFEPSAGTIALTRFLGLENDIDWRLGWNPQMSVHLGLPHGSTENAETWTRLQEQFKASTHLGKLKRPAPIYGYPRMVISDEELPLSSFNELRISSKHSRGDSFTPKADWLLNTETADLPQLGDRRRHTVGDWSPNSPVSAVSMTFDGDIYSSTPDKEDNVHAPLVAKLEDSDMPKKSSSLSEVYKSVWPRLNTKNRILIIIAFLCACGTGVATPIFSYLFAELLATFYTNTGRMEHAKVFSISILCVGLFDGLVSYHMHSFFEYIGQTWVNELRKDALRRILLQPKSWFDKKKNDPNRINECLDRNGEEMRNLVGRFIGYLVVAVVMITVSIVWALIASWKLALICLACLPVVYGLTRAFQFLSSKWEKRSNASATASSDTFQEALRNIRTVRAHSLELYFRTKYHKAVQETYHIGQRKAAWTGLFYGLTQSTTIFITAIIFYFGSMLISQGQVSINSMLEASMLLLFGIGNANAVIAYIPQISSSLVTAHYMLYLAHLDEKASFETHGQISLHTPLPIKLNNVNFAYPSRPNHQVLRNLSLSFEPGSCTAITGSSGCGKSTLAQLLLGLYAPSQTIIDSKREAAPLTFANTSVFKCHMPSLRSQVAFVTQTPVLFPTTVMENITYGLRPDSTLRNMRHVQLAAQAAGIHDFITSLPAGYATLIGDGGQGLSGGQAQRIAIARALLRRPKVLVLDEATSALDGENAEMVMQTISRLVQPVSSSSAGIDAALAGSRAAGRGRAGLPMSEMAVVMITHNIEMMRMAQKVVYLDEGRVVQAGTFEGMSRDSNGPFAKFISGQKEM